jgi:hypothetical protein
MNQQIASQDLSPEAAYISNWVFREILGLNDFVLKPEQDRFRVELLSVAGVLSLPNGFLALAEKNWLSPASLPHLPLPEASLESLSEAQALLQSASSRIAQEHRVLGEFIDFLPKCSHCSLGCSPSITNWLPFCWRGFQQSSYYTYRITSLWYPEIVWQRIDKKLKSDIKKVRTRFQIEVETVGIPAK